METRDNDLPTPSKQLPRLPEDLSPPAARWNAVADWFLVLLVCLIHGGTPVPGVNEPHYLVKALHYWDDSLGGGDVFLNSGDAHVVFYWSFGWVTQWLDLPAAAWVGRFTTWGLLAAAWTLLFRLVFPRPFIAALASSFLLMLTAVAHMAGEWIVGGVEAKGFAFAAVFFALAAVYRARWNTAFVLLGLATMLHVLVGGWIALGCGLAWLLSDDRRRWLRRLPAFAAAAGLAAIGIWPALQLNAGVSPEVVREAQEIYVYERLGHHLLFQRFPPLFVARHVAVWIGFAALWMVTRRDPGVRRIALVVAATGVYSVVGIVLSQLAAWYPAWAAGWLRFYWFRAADVMAPLGLTLCGVVWLRDATGRQATWARWMGCLAVVAIIAWLGHTFYLQRLDPRPMALVQASSAGNRSASELRQEWAAWRETCQWIRNNTPEDALFLTPRFQQSFKWYARRGEVVTWKDVPQDASALVTWWNTFYEVFPRRLEATGLAGHGPRRLRELAARYHADYVVLDRQLSTQGLPWKRVFPAQGTARFEVYRVEE